MKPQPPSLPRKSDESTKSFFTARRSYAVSKPRLASVLAWPLYLRSPYDKKTTTNNNPHPHSQKQAGDFDRPSTPTFLVPPSIQLNSYPRCLYIQKSHALIPLRRPYQYKRLSFGSTLSWENGLHPDTSSSSLLHQDLA